MLSRLPPVTKALLLANVLVYVLQLLVPENYLMPFKLWPIALDADPFSPTASFMPWQLVTYAFMHGDPLHIAMNLICLLMFGAELESYWGSRRFLVFYAVCAIGAGLCQLGVATLMLSQNGWLYTSLGASGGVFGLLAGYAMEFPDRRVGLMFLPVMMKARTLVIIFAVAQLLLAFSGLETGEAHFAHLGGMLFGWLLIRRWRRPRPPKSPEPPKPGKRPSHLRVVK
jgi:membrane associated rhomboid family serine protease